MAKPGFIISHKGAVISLKTILRKKKINVIIFYTIYDKYSLLAIKKIETFLSSHQKINQKMQLIKINIDDDKEHRRNLRQKVILKKISLKNNFYDKRSRVVKKYFGRKEIIRGAVFMEEGVIIEKFLDQKMKYLQSYLENNFKKKLKNNF